MSEDKTNKETKKSVEVRFSCVDTFYGRIQNYANHKWFTVAEAVKFATNKEITDFENSEKGA